MKNSACSTVPPGACITVVTVSVSHVTASRHVADGLATMFIVNMLDCCAFPAYQ